MSKKLAKILTATVFVMLGVSPVFSQSENGKIAGQVTEPHGLAIPNAKNFDQRCSFSLNCIYDLPLPKILYNYTHFLDDDPTNELSSHKPRARAGSGQTSAVSDFFLRGWQLSGITVFHTGTPFSVINGRSYRRDAHDPRILQFGLKFAFHGLISGYIDIGLERESIASMMRGTQS